MGVMATATVLAIRLLAVLHSSHAGFNESCRNCLDVFSGAEEGMSLRFEREGKLWYQFFRQNNHFNWKNEEHVYSGHSESKNPTHGAYTRIKVGERKENNRYPLKFGYWDEDEPKFKTYTEDMQVHYNSDGTVSFSCTRDGHSKDKYMTWDNGMDSEWPHIYWAVDKNSKYPPVCTSPTNCATCRFSAVNGAIDDLNIKIVDVKWGEPEDMIASTPNIVDQSISENYAEADQTRKFSVEYQNTVSDSTSWENSWGYELATSLTVTAGIPDVDGVSWTTSATVSYDGSYGGDHTSSNTTTVHDEITTICPGRTRCILNYVAYKLDDFTIPFTATVQKTMDDGSTKQWEELGSWTGVQAFQFNSIFCTESLDTGDSNCPF